jgi:hypothetical protein
MRILKREDRKEREGAERFFSRRIRLRELRPDTDAESAEKKAKRNWGWCALQGGTQVTWSLA